MTVSISRIKLFKACRKAYQLKYIEGLEPIEKADSLQAGISYHEKLEQLYEEGSFDATDYSKESAMATAYQKYIYPKFKCTKAEEWVEYKLMTGDTLVGRVDGIAEDGSLVEHKTTGSEIGEDHPAIEAMSRDFGDTPSLHARQRTFDIRYGTRQGHGLSTHQKARRGQKRWRTKENTLSASCHSSLPGAFSNSLCEKFRQLCRPTE